MLWGLTRGLPALHSPVIMSRHRAIIKGLGGYVVVANQLGLHEETVKSWLKCDRGIPARHWHRIAQLTGLTVAHLERTSPKWRNGRNGGA